MATIQILLERNTGLLWGLAFGAGFGIMGPIRKQAGVDVEAAYMNNNPLPRCNTFILY